MKKYYPGLLLFTVALVIGLLCYKAYGISWDEPTQQGLGRLTYNYIATGDETIKTYDDRALGTAFELPLVCIEKWFGIKEQHAVYEMRHLVTHIYFLLGALAAYVLALKLFKNQWLACLAFLMLVCNPRMYAHSFFNSKDIPFLSAFIIAMLLCYVAFEKGRVLWFLAMGCAVGYAIGIRAIGVVLVPCMVVFFVADAIAEPAGRKKAMAGLSAFLLATCVALYVSWPYLWGDPVFYIRDAFHQLAVINWKATVLFMGKTYNGMELPVSYLPVWFAITTPLVWLFCGLAGILIAILGFVRQPLRSFADRHNRHFLMYLACFVLPPAAAIINHSAIIDDWRHMYFIYGPFVMLCLYCISSVKNDRHRKVLSVVGYVQVWFTFLFMVANHPCQQVYFNELVSHEKEYLRMHYDLEYWGCAYKQGLQYILEHDQSSVINISGAGHDPAVNALRALPDSVQKRVRITDEEHADYFITNFRIHPADYQYPVVLTEVKVQNSTIMRVYKIH